MKKETTSPASETDHYFIHRTHKKGWAQFRKSGPQADPGKTSHAAKKPAWLLFLYKHTSWSNMELGLLKACLISLGIYLGLYFSAGLLEYADIFGSVFLFSAVWAFYLWLKKLRSSR